MAAPNIETFPSTGVDPETGLLSGELLEENPPPYLIEGTYTREMVGGVDHVIADRSSFSDELRSERYRYNPEDIDLQGKLYRIPYGEGEYSSSHKVRVFNKDNVDNGENAIVVLGPWNARLESEPDGVDDTGFEKKNGWYFEAVQEVVRQFPDRVVIAIGNEGTTDVATVGLDSEYSPETTPFATIHCVEEIFDMLWEDPPTKFDIIAKSKGNITGVQMVRCLRELHPYLRVDNFVMEAPTLEAMSGFKLALKVLRQESAVFFQSPREEQKRLLGFVATKMIPEAIKSTLNGSVFSKSNWRSKCRQLRHAAETSVQATDLNEGNGDNKDATKYGVIAHAGDGLAPLEYLLQDGPVTGRNVKCLTKISSKGRRRTGHTTHLIGCEEAGEDEKMVIRWLERAA